MRTKHVKKIQSIIYQKKKTNVPSFVIMSVPVDEINVQ